MNCSAAQITLCVLMMLLVSEAQADSFRCGTRLVKTGDSIGRLLETCGKPAHKYKAKVSIRSAGSRKTTSVTNWVYQRGSKKNMVVSLLSGSVVKISTEK